MANPAKIVKAVSKAAKKKPAKKKPLTNKQKTYQIAAANEKLRKKAASPEVRDYWIAEARRLMKENLEKKGKGKGNG
jgi:hypothetical protein